MNGSNVAIQVASTQLDASNKFMDGKTDGE